MNNHKSVLIADDDEEDCMLAEFALNKALPEATFCSVADGVELIAHLQERSGNGQLPRLILLDLNMPRLDGRQALVRIKSDPVLKHIPIVILTTSSEQKDIELTMNAGAEKFLTKPALMDEWTEMMRSLVEKWQD